MSYLIYNALVPILGPDAARYWATALAVTI